METVPRAISKTTLEHLFLVAISLSLAIATAIPLGILSAKNEAFGQTILGVVGVIQTLPSMAILVFMIPMFGLGAYPAIAALFFYSLLPIVRNTYAGLTQIPKATIESAIPLILQGAVPAAVLALLVQYGFSMVERRFVSPGLQARG